MGRPVLVSDEIICEESRTNSSSLNFFLLLLAFLCSLRNQMEMFSQSREFEGQVSFRSYFREYMNFRLVFVDMSSLRRIQLDLNMVKKNEKRFLCERVLIVM